MATLRPRTPPRARAVRQEPVTRCQSSGQLGALLSSPVLGVRLITALQVLQGRTRCSLDAGERMSHEVDGGVANITDDDRPLA